MKSVLVDMDGVLADVYSRFFDLHEEENGLRPDMKNVEGKLEEEVFSNLLKWVTTPGFFRSIPVIPGSQEGLKKLNDNYFVIVASLATEFPQSLTEKQLWLHDHFSFISWEQMVFCGDKNVIKADIMIDDHLKNLNKFKGETIMFTQPHNIMVNNTKHKRANSWEEIVKLLLSDRN